MKNIITPTQGSLRVTLLRLFSLAIAMTVTLHAFAQAPQGFNYQAVVLNSSGAALSNQTVSLQLSILDSSASGVAVYVETQNPTTDTTGLFSVVIGNGTVVTGNFSTINWGKNYKFLKTEIDTAGGSNYVLMGISQMMSVPYALYANEAKESYGSFDYPDGLNNITTVFLDSNVAYTVPSGKNLYLPYVSNSVLVGSDTIYPIAWTGYTKITSPGFSEGQTVISYDSIQCFLVDKKVDWITQDITSSPLTVPNGKIFVIVFANVNPYCLINYSFFGNLSIDGHTLDHLNLFSPIIIGSGQTITSNTVGCHFYVNGYFRDN